ncbi:hypothetical protein CRYUN_Cryun23aG0013500 [Craigia yunnanensis]
MNHRRFPSSLFPLPIIFVLQVMLGIPHSLCSPEAYKDCRDTQFECGNISAGYPFTRHDGSFPYCGYPSLQLNCENDTSIIEIVDERYQVLDIHPDRQTLRIARKEFIENDLCNQEFQNSTLDSELFDFVNAPGCANVTLLYGCANSIQTFLGHFNCSLNRAGYKDFWVVSEDMDYVPCSGSVTVPILQSTVENFNYSLLVRDLQEGFEVKWKQYSQVCRKCEETGGACGVGSANQTICYCPNEKNPLDEKAGCTRLPQPAAPPSGGTQPKAPIKD